MVGASDSTDESEERETAKVRFPSLRSVEHLCLAGMQVHRTRLLKELSARLHRDRMLRYTERELEMQRMMMGKGRRRKVKGVERVEKSDEEDDGEQTRTRGKGKGVEEKLYRPRVYRWRAERKR